MRGSSLWEKRCGNKSMIMAPTGHIMQCATQNLLSQWRFEVSSKNVVETSA